MSSQTSQFQTGSKELFFNRVYIADNYTKSSGYGFYSDGRLICFNSDDGLALREKDIVGKKWNNAIAIGYWRVEGNKIQIEYFVCQDGGFYNLKEGKIINDTLIFYRNMFHPSRKDIREERYLLSNMNF